MKAKSREQFHIKPELINCMKKGYKPKSIFKDAFAGLMVALVALPLNLAMGHRQSYDGFSYAIQIGLWSAIVGGLLLSIFGGTRFSIGGPTAPFITIIVVLIGTAGQSMHNVFFATAIAGVLLIIASLLKAGKLLKYVAHPVFMGICLGIGVALLFNLLSDMGLTLATHTPLTESMDLVSPFLSRLTRTVMGIPQFSLYNFVVGLTAAVLVYMLPKIHKKIPAIIVAIAVATGVGFLMGLTNSNTDLLRPNLINGGDTIDNAFNYHFINFGRINFSSPFIYLFAIAIAMIASLEGMMSSSAVEKISGIKFNPNTELFGHGVANLGSGLAGGLPITAAMARTNLNYENGAKSNFAGIFQALFLLVFYVALMPVMRFIPVAALVSPLVKVAIATSFYPLVVRMLRFSKRDSSILIVTGLITIIFGVHFGVIVGIAFAYAINAKRFKNKLEMKTAPIKETPVTTITKHFRNAQFDKKIALDNDIKAFIQSTFSTTDVLLTSDNPDLESLRNAKPISEDVPVKSQTIYLSGSLFFVNINKVIEKATQIFMRNDEVVLDMQNVKDIDGTVAERLSKLTVAAAKNQKRLAVINMFPASEQLYIKAFSYIIKKW